MSNVNLRNGDEVKQKYAETGVRWLLTIVLLIVLFLLTLPVQAGGASSDPLTPDQLHAAQVAAGEAPIAMVGVDGFVGVLCTMQARLESNRFPSTLPEVLSAYYAPPRPMTAQEEAIAEDVLVYGSECGGGPYFWALSYQDVDRLLLRAGDWVTQPHTLPSGLEIGIHFYADSPWKENHP